MTAIKARLRGLPASLAIVLFLIGTPSALHATGATPWDTNLSQLTTLLTSPDDGTLALVVFAVVAWGAWAVGALLFAVEIAYATRGIPAPHLPGLGVPQQFAGRLVASAALLFVVAPTIAPGFLTPPAHSMPAPEPASITISATGPVEAAPTQTATEAELVEPTTVIEPTAVIVPEQDTFDYTTRRGDSLWKLAGRFLGNSERYLELHALNRDVLGPDPGFLPIGVTLRIPAIESHTTPDAPTANGDRTVKVEPDETLSEIALEEVGNAQAYKKLFEASKSTIQPDGRKLRDPDLIYPGWIITIPGDASEHADQAPHGGTPEPLPEPTTPAEQYRTPAPMPTPTPTPEASFPPEVTPSPDVDSVRPSAGADAVEQVDEDSDTSDQAGPAWLVPGLSGAGVVLAGGLLLALRGYRRTQLRYRRPGQVIAPPPPELAAVEKTTHLTGAPMAQRIEDVDRVLRHLSIQCEVDGRPMPDVAAAELAADAVTLHLSHPSNPPEGWIGAPDAWTFTFDGLIPPADQIAPYPMLATIGQADDGHLWLANLEELGPITLTGNTEAAEALARAVAAELTLNPWAYLVYVDAVGIAAEFAELDRMNFQHHEIDDLAFLERVGAELTARSGSDPDEYRALLLHWRLREEEAVQDVVRALAQHSNRVGATLITLGGDPAAEDTVIVLTEDGRVLVPTLGLDLRAAGLSAEEATVSAEIARVTRDAEPQSVPSNDPDAEGWRALSDQAGALQDHLAGTRPFGPAGEESLLPLDLWDYATRTAAVAEDLGTLAPVVSAPRRMEVEAADPTLDADVASWLDPTSRLPKLSVLGPVRAQAHGDATAVAKRKPHYLEMLTFLALHPAGVSSAQVGEAFGLKKERVRIDIGVVRKWLGENSATGQTHVPPATQSSAAEQSGVWTYQVNDLLLDADLFRRLRARGQARGAAGQADYDLALQLVTGQPFAELREKGWSWLLDSDSRVDDTLACAIVDVAHTVVTDALATGDVTRAHHAAEVALNASPYDEVARLDFVAVLVAEGHQDAAEKFLKDEVCNRSDDNLAPVDLPGRTAEIIAQRSWAKTGRPRST